MPEKGLAAAVDIGGTKILAALVTRRGKILARKKVKVPKGIAAAGLLRLAADAVRALDREVPGARRRTLAAGVGVPGTVDAERGRVVRAPNVDLSGAAVGPRLAKALGVPVAVGNDVNLALAGERWLGAGAGCRDLVAVFPGTGVGGGVLCGGRLAAGANGAAAEIGHMIVDEDGPRCGCGNRGCLEAVAGRRAIEARVRAAVRGGRKSAVTKLAGRGLRSIRSKILNKALKREDPVVLEVMREAAEALGGACVTLRHLFDPEKFIFGGGVIEACGWFMLPVIRRRLAKDRFFASFRPCPVVPAALGDDAVVLGAAAEAFAAGRRRRS